MRPKWKHARRIPETQLSKRDPNIQDLIRSTVMFLNSYRFAAGSIPGAIRAWMNETGMTQKQVADKLGTTKGYVNDILKERITPGPAFVVHLMDALTTGNTQPRLRNPKRVKVRKTGSTDANQVTTSELSEAQETAD